MKINKVNYENFIIDYLEGSLSPDLKAEFDGFLQVNPKVYEEIKLYLSAPVFAEPNETVFAEKDLLKRKVISYRWLASLAAAVAVLLIGSFFFFNRADNQSNMANSEDPKQELSIENPVEQKTRENTHQANQQEIVGNKNIAAIEVKKATKENSTAEFAKPAKEVIKEKASLHEIRFDVNKTPFSSNQNQIVATDNYRVEKKHANHSTQIIEKERTAAVFANLEPLEIEPVSTIEDIHIIYVPSAMYAFNEEIEETTKNNKIIDLFMTKAYDDVDLKEAVVANNLDRLNISKDKIREMLLPESILN